MRTLLPDPPPPELQDALEGLLARRRQWGADTHDEVWEGVRHLVPGPSFEHARVMQLVAVQLGPPAKTAALLAVMRFTLGESEHDYRVPDGGLVRPGAAGVFQASTSPIALVARAG